MTSWNNRIVYYERNGEFVYELCEVFYDEDGKILGFGEIYTYGESREELERSYKMMAEAFRAPVIVYKNDTFIEKDEA